MEKDYEVGYKKPPKATQFKPGQSGNKNGRPKGIKNFHTLIEKFASQKITIKENGKVTELTKQEAAILQQVNKSAQGDSKAFKLLVPFFIQADIKAEEVNAFLAKTNIDDREILNILAKDYKNGENENET